MRKRKLVIAVLYAALVCLGTAEIASAAGLQTHKTFTNSIGMEFVLIPAGSFMMGTDPNVEKSSSDEISQHNVTISKPFYLGKYEVTQAQWEVVMGSNPSGFKGRSNPVEQVSWNDVQVFIRRLNEKEGHQRYRLPTEAEWEYAARAGTNSAYSFGGDKNELSEYAWYGAYASSGSTHPVGEKQPNPWGLHDIHGNVYEWVQDLDGESYYVDSPETDPKGPTKGYHRVMRGGSWFSNLYSCRSSSRHNNSPRNRDDEVGFRLALSPE